MSRAKKIEPIHPLRMADAITEINTRCGNVIMAAHTARDLAPSMNETQLRGLLNVVCDAADELKAALWPEDPD